MTRKEMQDTFIRSYGFEHPLTIQFFELCEKYEDNEWNNKTLEILTRAHIAHPQNMETEE